MNAPRPPALVMACALFALIPAAGSGYTRDVAMPLSPVAPREPAAEWSMAGTGVTLTATAGRKAPDGIDRTLRIANDQMSFAAGVRRPSVQVGETYKASKVHIVTEPGRYGLGNPPEDSKYAVIDNYLVRVDAKSTKVLSVIRLVDKILD